MTEPKAVKAAKPKLSVVPTGPAPAAPAPAPERVSPSTVEIDALGRRVRIESATPLDSLLDKAFGAWTRTDPRRPALGFEPTDG